MQQSRPGRRVAIVAGIRTPFLKSGTVLRDVSAVALARHAARELLFRSEIDGREVDEVIFSQVVPSVLTPNVGREVSLLPQLLPSVPAYTLNRACASSAQAITDAADQIALGHAHVAIAGGAESLSNVPILHSRGFSDALVAASRARSLSGRLRGPRPDSTSATLSPSPPRSPSRPRERHGAVGGEDGQDQRHLARGPGSVRVAVASRGARRHGRRPARRRDRAVVACLRGSAVATDNGIREDTSLEQLAALRPVFDRKYGTVTAGNSSPLTDGAAAVLLMREDRARPSASRRWRSFVPTPMPPSTRGSSS